MVIIFGRGGQQTFFMSMNKVIVKLRKLSLFKLIIPIIIVLHTHLWHQWQIDINNHLNSCLSFSSKSFNQSFISSLRVRGRPKSTSHRHRDLWLQLYRNVLLHKHLCSDQPSCPSKNPIRYAFYSIQWSTKLYARFWIGLLCDRMAYMILYVSNACENEFTDRF